MHRTWATALILALIPTAIYWRVSQHDFVNYDDNDYVTANPRVQAGLTLEGLSWAFGRLHGEKTYYHPLTWLSHMLDCELFGLKPGPHHLVNLLFHALNTLLLFVVLKRMTGAHWQSAAVAALFALHPLQVDTVAWVSERKNLLSAFFWILAMGAYARYAEKPSVGRYSFVFLSMAVGLLAKPTLVTLPFALLLLDFWPLRRVRWFQSADGQNRPVLPENSAAIPRVFSEASFWRLLLEKLPLLALSIASSIVTTLSHDALGIQQSVFGLPLHLRLENALVSYVRYLDKTLWPANLSVLYLHPGEWPWLRVAFSALVLLAITGLVLWKIRRRPYFLVGWLWFLGVLVPTIGIRQAGIQAMADRWAYLPVIGLFVMAVWGAMDFAGRWRQRCLILGVTAGAALAALSISTSLQLRHWKNSFTLWEKAVEVDPNNFIAHGNVSVAYTEAGNLVAAWHHAQEAVRAKPAFMEGHLQLGLISLLEGKFDEAREHYRTAMQMRSEAGTIIKQIADRMAGAGKFDLAVAQCSTYLQLAPDDVAARAQLALILSAAQKTAEAIAQYRELLRRKPNWPEALNNLAWILATQPQAELRNGAEAVRLAERACELTGRKHAVFIGTLAAAYAEAGRFADATKAGQEAHDVALAAGQKQLAETNKKLLEFYRANRPYRQEGL